MPRFVENGQFDHKSHRKGGCLRCGSPALTDGDRPGVYNLFSDDWANYELCVPCVVEMGADQGMIAADKAQELRQSNRVYGTKNKALKARVDGYEKIVGSLMAPDAS
jgi:hypothetical protein